MVNNHTNGNSLFNSYRWTLPATTNRETLQDMARRILLLLTDSDGVLTDGGVYCSPRGEELKRFNVRDGMGIERLRRLAGVETGIVSRDASLALRARASKLGISELHLGIADKSAALDDIMRRRGLSPEQIAFIGDDVNDVAVMRRVGLSACPADGMPAAREAAVLLCHYNGGQGAFREFAEFILAVQIGADKSVEPENSALSLWAGERA